MAKARIFKINFTGGEASPRLEARPDLQRYFNMCLTLENYLIFPQGGIYRAPGTRMVAEVKDSSVKTRLLPFIFSRSQAYVLELGNQYARFFKNIAPVSSGGAPYEIATPWAAADLFALQWVQSADVIFVDHQSYNSRKVSRVSDTNWSIPEMSMRPPPSTEQDDDVSGGVATLTPSATSGLGITFTASAAAFLKGDEDRDIIFGAARAVITIYTSATVVTADIIDPFPSTAAIPAGQWFLRGTPSSFCDPTKKKQRTKVTVVGRDDAGLAQDTFRQTDVGKFIKVYGGLIEITEYTSANTVKGIIRVALSLWTGRADGTQLNNPDSTPLWTLEKRIWTVALGFPVANTFYQGRLTHGSAPLGTFVLSATDDFENYGVGAKADNALQYQIVRQQGNVVWLADLGSLFIATPESIFAARGPGTDQPLGGDVIPFVRKQDAPGSMAMMPLVIGTTALYVSASGQRVHELKYDIDASPQSPFRAGDLTAAADHIGGKGGFALDQIAWWETPNRHCGFLRADGQVAYLTYFPVPEQVAGWSRRTTQGVIESQCVIPHPDGNRDQVWMIVRRTINGQTKRFVEVVEDGAAEFAGNRAWTELYTDCAKIYSGAAVTNIPAGFGSHLEGATVDVVTEGGYKGTRTIVGGQFNQPLQEAAAQIEFGLPYTSKMVTLRPAAEGAILHWLPKMWNRIGITVKDSFSAHINGKEVFFAKSGDPMDTVTLKSGDFDITDSGWDKLGRITVEQREPLPQTILALYGELNVGDR